MIAVQNRISSNLESGLDVARALAAIYVVVYHVCSSHGLTTGVWSLFRFGQEAVITFFLLSGCVIFANEAFRADGARGYYARRLSRIYPTLLFAMAVSTIVAWDAGTLRTSFSLNALLGTIFALQDTSSFKPGVITDPYLGNAPLWSLSYEIAFYAVFPLALKLWRLAPAVSNNLVGILSCVAYATYVIYPNHWSLVASYFLIWWAGAMAAASYLQGGASFLSMPTVVCWLGVIAAIAGLDIFWLGSHGVGNYPVLMFRHFFAALIIIMIVYGPVGRILCKYVGILSIPAGYVASISYGIYVLHYPVMVSWGRFDGAKGVLIGAFLTVLLAAVSDRAVSKRLRAIRRRKSGSSLTVTE